MSELWVRFYTLMRDRVGWTLVERVLSWVLGPRADGMVAQGSFRIATKRRWPRFHLGTLLLAVAVLGPLLAGMITAIPWVLWRYHVAQALETAQSAGPGLSWSFDAVGAPTPRPDELLYLLSDRERVLGELLRSVERNPNDLRRVNAVQTMRALLKQSCPLVLRKRCLDQALAGHAGAGRWKGWVRLAHRTRIPSVRRRPLCNGPDSSG
jgi:hypothetical protein